MSAAPASRAGTDDVWLPLRREFDRWAEAGRRIVLWLRDDDAVQPNPALDRLAELAAPHRAPVLLAMIPFPAGEALAERLERAPLLLPCQHGMWHHNHAPSGEKKSECGLDRPLAAVLAEIAAGRDRLGALFGQRLLPVFVPPWNRIDPEVAAGLPALGFRGLSCFGRFALGPAGGPALLNTDIDIVDWQGGRRGKPAAQLVADILSRLREARQPEARLGILLHHLDHDDACWDFLEGLLAEAESHPAVIFGDPRTFLACAPGEPGEAFIGRRGGL